MKPTIKYFSEKILANPTRLCRGISTKKDSHEAAQHYRAVYDFTVDIFKSFQHIHLSVKDEFLCIRYYKGKGKDFTEGKARIKLDLLDETVLIPELLNIISENKTTIHNYTPTKIYP